MKRLALLIALVLLATLPLWIGNSYYVNIATQILIYADPRTGPERARGICSAWSRSVTPACSASLPTPERS